MNISFYTVSSEPNRITKTLGTATAYSGTLREGCSIIDPILMIESATVPGNYCYIPDFSRYYFVKNIVAQRKNLWAVSCHVDVLMSWDWEIEHIPVIIDRTENTGKNPYIASDVYKRTVKDMTQIITFPSGLSETGEYILITAGGGSDSNVGQIAKLTAWHKAQIGTAESPLGSNSVRYNDEFYGYHVSGDAYPWCAAYLWCGFYECGLENLTYKTAGSTTLMNWAISQGRFISSGYQQGDVIFFSWTSTPGDADHCGYCVSATANDITTIDGNVSDKVSQITRSYTNVIGGFRPNYT